MLPPERIDKYSPFSSSRAWITEEEQVDEMTNSFPCPAMVRLSADVCTENDLLCLCILAPNLIGLKIKRLRPSHILSNYSTLAALIPRPTHLTKLDIICTDDDDDDDDDLDDSYRIPFEILIKSYQSSLEQLTLIVHTNNFLLNGRHLEALVKPCQRLQKLQFVIKYQSREIIIADQLKQFQSDWWLDDRQPPVLILQDDYDHICISSMPCTYPMSLRLSPNLKVWRLNKGQLDSPLIYFTN
ncbi:unnamed protein product, partial [Rotaria sordida]